VETVLRIGLSNALCSAALAAFAWSVGRSLRRPAISHVLWVLVLLKLVTPPLWTIGVRAVQPPDIAPRPPVTAAIDAVSSSPHNVSISTPAAAKHSPAKSSTRQWNDWLTPLLLGAWLVGSLACLITAAARLFRFGRVIQFAAKADAPLQARVDELSARLGIRRPPRALLVPGRVCPMLWAALGRPKLLLPGQLWYTLADSQRSSLILHELAHLKRRDHWVRWQELLATVAYWWDPLVWWARHQLRAAEEQCCDAWVAWSMPSSREAYASALVETIDFVSCSGFLSRPRLPALASGMGEFRHLQRRLVMIQQGTSTRRLGWTGFVVICAAAIVLPLSLTRGQSPARQASGPSAHDEHNAKPPATQPAEDDDPASAALYNRVVPEISFEGVGLADVIAFLRDVSDANVFVNWKALEAASIDRNAPVTVQMKNVKFSKVLDTVLQSVGAGQTRLAYFFDNNVLTITTADDASKETVTRVYDLHDFAPGDPKARYADLFKAIVDTCCPDSWKDNGGSVGVLREVDGLLVVVQTEENQRLVKELLAKMRKVRQEGSKL
jgi:beta-lactamase regulating signal transducer with metallopeptidase domain